MVKNIYRWPLWHWHFEASSICTLQCPRCPRTELPDTLVQTSLSLKFFEKNFTPHFLQTHVTRMSFCGDDGDPIYAKDFLKIIEYIKKCNPCINLLIVTNGSYKTVKWWNTLSTILNEYDEIHFSLDGWDQASNETYRRNSDWESIINGVAELRKNTMLTIRWAAIVFKYNQQKIEHMQNLAKQLGFDSFQLTYSSKFGINHNSYNINGIDDLQPEEQYITNGRFTRENINFTDRTPNITRSIAANLKHYENRNSIGNITPLCWIGNKGLYINSQGNFFPCCWVGNRYDMNTYNLFMRPELNLNTSNIETVLNWDGWTDMFNKFGSISECLNKCASHNVTQEYSTKW
jgi:MoaA/NifB/PqqE/SkfB family radical SAM enzyme